MRIKYADPLRRVQAGDASRLFHRLSDYPPHTLAIVAARVSGRRKPRLQQLAKCQRQAESVRDVAIAAGFDVRHSFGDVASGFNAWWAIDAYDAARRLARETGKRVVVISESVDRNVRQPAFRATTACRDLRARESDLDDLAMAARGVELVTILDPNASAEECRNYRKRRVGAKRGPKLATLNPRCGPKKERRSELQKVATLLASQGKSQVAISAELNVPRTTIRRWLRSGKRGVATISR